MREIKFRAWDKINKKMVHHDDANFIDMVVRFDGVVWCHDSYFGITSENFELMQYTGLLDKNGVEVYEGDILQMVGKVRQPRWEVVWYENGWQMKLVWIKGHLPERYYVKLSSDKVVEFDEVVGNRYENPVLLTTVKEEA